MPIVYCRHFILAIARVRLLASICVAALLASLAPIPPRPATRLRPHRSRGRAGPRSSLLPLRLHPALRQVPRPPRPGDPGPIRQTPPPRPRAGHPRPPRPIHLHRRRAIRQPRRLRPPPHRHPQGPAQDHRRHRPLVLSPQVSARRPHLRRRPQDRPRIRPRPPRIRHRAQRRPDRLVQAPSPHQTIPHRQSPTHRHPALRQGTRSTSRSASPGMEEPIPLRHLAPPPQTARSALARSAASPSSHPPQSARPAS